MEQHHTQSFSRAARCGRIRPAVPIRTATVAIAVVIGMFGSGLLQPTTARAADAPVPQVAPLMWDELPLEIDSGLLAHDGVTTEAQPVFARVIDGRDAAWMRLTFGDVHLAGSHDADNQAVLRITSLHDGGQQILDAVSIQQWQYSSAYFNGSAVQVELIVHPNTPPSRVEITGYQHGVVVGGAGQSFCDGTDTRELATAAPDARLLPVGCTGWLVGERCFISAGHCQSHGEVNVAEFNVPLSYNNGTIKFADPEDQYPVDPASRQWQFHAANPHAGCADDWMSFGTFENSNTGLTPYEAQGERYTMADSIPEPTGQTIRVRGYGSTTSSPLPGKWNQVLKIGLGPYVAFSDAMLQFRVDASSGDSGSAIYDTESGTVIGIVTCAGCSAGWPAYIGNRGTPITHPNLQAALANPLGVCALEPLHCPADLDGNDVVDGQDLLILLSAWGPNLGHPADLNGNGMVNGQDLLLLLAAWGECL